MNDLILLFTQGANRMRGRLGSVDSFERSNSVASEKVRKWSSPFFCCFDLAKTNTNMVLCLLSYFIMSPLWLLKNNSWAFIISKKILYISSFLSTKKRSTTWELWVKFYLGQNENCSLGGSISDSSERLLQSSSGESQYKVFVKGEFNTISTYFTKGFLLVRRIWCHHEGI